MPEHHRNPPGGNEAPPPTAAMPGPPDPDETQAPGPGDSANIAEWPAVEDFEILEEIGRGGMGIVYKARQLSRQRIVALKVIRRERLVNPEAVRRFRREAQAAARLAHPNIVLIFDSDHTGDTHYLVMEYVAGVTLQHLVEQSGPLPADQACALMRQAALGLQHAFEQGLVHRDIKPSNLMVTLPARSPTVSTGAAAPQRDWSKALVKILDMGVARLHHLEINPEESLSTLTHDGSVIGTPDYIAPEQLEDAHAADIRADLYSLGCTFYYLLTGEVPFPGGTLIQKLDKQRWETAPSADQVRPDIPPELAALVRKLMAKSPTDRYQTPAELAAALEQLTRTGHLPAAPAPAPLRQSRRFTGHTDRVNCLAVSPDGRRVLSGGKDRTVRLWETATGSEVRCLTAGMAEVRSVAFSPDGRQMLSAAGATLRLWDVDTGQEVTRLFGHTDTVCSVAFTPDGSRILSGGADRTVRLWDVQTGREVRRLARATAVSCVAVAADGIHAVTAGRDQGLHLWDLHDGRELAQFGGVRGPVLAVAFSPDSRQILSGHFDMTLRLWDAAGGRELRRLAGHERMVAGVAFLPDGLRAISGSADGTLRLWDLEGTRELGCGTGHTDAVTCVAVVPDGRYALAGGADQMVSLWALPID